MDINSLKKQVKEKINSEPQLNIEYFEIADRNTLQPVRNWRDSTELIACIAVFAGKIRLIDNIIY